MDFIAFEMVEDTNLVKVEVDWMESKVVIIDRTVSTVYRETSIAIEDTAETAD